MTDNPPGLDDMTELAITTAGIKEAKAALARYYDRRDELMIRLARLGVPYAEIADIAEIGAPAVSKITRAAGVRRYRQPD